MKLYNDNLFSNSRTNTIVGKIKITVDGFSCERCRHKWIPRNKEYPRVCPKCKSPYWDKPRKVKKKNNKNSDKK